ncbi:MAG: hypothetical protein PHC61_00850 [Chitinivibrionales bacterium]|nr:hypothetical protein [Chitinivibrionales bacterium]
MVEEYTRLWLKKALNDITVMHNERHAEAVNMVTEAICFHAQQAAKNFLRLTWLNT